MNNKGFTTVELILTIVLVVIIMGTITSVTYTYRDRSDYEKVVTEVVNYKNTVTRILYEDILYNKALGFSKVDDYTYKVIFASGDKTLSIFDRENLNDKTEIGINYDGVDYIIPGATSDYITLEGFDYYEDNVNNLYKLDINFKHRKLEDMYTIHLVIS